MNENIFPFSKIITDIFDPIIKNTESINIYDEWKEILREINVKSVGLNNEKKEDLSFHSRIVGLKKGILFIEVDHPGWIEILNINKKHILTKMKKKFPGFKFRTFVFYLKTSTLN